MAQSPPSGCGIPGKLVLSSIVAFHIPHTRVMLDAQLTLDLQLGIYHYETKRQEYPQKAISVRWPERIVLPCERLTQQILEFRVRDRHHIRTDETLSSGSLSLKQLRSDEPQQLVLQLSSGKIVFWIHWMAPTVPPAESCGESEQEEMFKRRA
eukprot:NODE_3826_length_910_cov_22.390244_g3520_i0.p1 GENE.NODE_3826_length_910_cov_22.390244_g3520_i0~~NODE_3826_length_910_cov_22.390244_g3520_i0.p1  ORF type:complete len:178 (+),score=41.05 NODE_3826_length_910_cov_22.390244_g3520_i0:77-535(+)